VGATPWRFESSHPHRTRRSQHGPADGFVSRASLSAQDESARAGRRTLEHRAHLGHPVVLRRPTRSTSTLNIPDGVEVHSRLTWDRIHARHEDDLAGEPPDRRGAGRPQRASAGASESRHLFAARGSLAGRISIGEDFELTDEEIDQMLKDSA
jgi:hypothetical protein